MLVCNFDACVAFQHFWTITILDFYMPTEFHLSVHLVWMALTVKYTAFRAAQRCEELR